MINAEKSDLYDVLAYIAFALSPITRSERVEQHQKQIYFGYDKNIQQFIEFVLDQYIKEGIGELDQDKLPDLLELKYHAVREAAEQLGGVARIRDAFVGFQRHLY